MNFTEELPQVPKEMRLMCCTQQHSQGMWSTAVSKSKIYWSSSPRKGETEVLCALGSQGSFSASDLWTNQPPGCTPGHPAVCNALNIQRVWFTSPGSTSALKLPLKELGTCLENNRHFWEITQLTHFGVGWISAPKSLLLPRSLFRGWALCLVRWNPTLFPRHTELSLPRETEEEGQEISFMPDPESSSTHRNCLIWGCCLCGFLKHCPQQLSAIYAPIEKFPSPSPGHPEILVHSRFYINLNFEEYGFLRL